MAAKRSSEAPQPTEAQPKPLPKVEFLLISHSIENAGHVAEKLKDTDVILMEGTGGSDAERKELEDEYNLVLRPPSSIQKKEELQQWDYLIGRLLYSPRFLDLVIFQLAGTGKEIRLIDISQEHPAYVDTEAGRKADIGIEDQLLRGDIEGALKMYKALVDRFTAANPLREQHVVDQIEEILPTIGRGKKVTVVQGMSHSPTRFRVGEGLKDKADITMEFAPRGAVLTTATRLVRLKTALGVEIDEDDYRMGLLADHIFEWGISEIIDPDASRADALRLALELAGTLTSKETDEAYAEFPKIYKEKLADLPPSRRRPHRAVKRTAIEMAKIWAKKKGVIIPGAGES